MCMGTEFPQATAAHYFSLVSPCILLTLCLSTLQIKREQTINDQKEVLLNLPAPLRSQIFQGTASLYTSFFQLTEAGIVAATIKLPTAHS